MLLENFKFFVHIGKESRKNLFYDQRRNFVNLNLSKTIDDDFPNKIKNEIKFYRDKNKKKKKKRDKKRTKKIKMCDFISIFESFDATTTQRK